MDLITLSLEYWLYNNYIKVCSTAITFISYILYFSFFLVYLRLGLGGWGYRL